VAFALWDGSGAQAQSCQNLFAAIRKEAAYCGFFCDDARLQLLQGRYEVSCITFVAAPSPLESQPPAAPWPLSCRRTGTAAIVTSADVLRARIE
jgi:hypothetical protein